MNMTSILRGIVRFLYCSVLLAYPVIEKIGIAYILYQFVMMIYYWDTPGKHPGYKLVGAFILMSILFTMVANFDDKETINRNTVKKNNR
jgi:hypothetical protein